MKVIYIYGNIINCEEIRNVEKFSNRVRVCFKSHRSESSGADYLWIECQSEEDANDMMDLIFNEMTAK